MSEEKILKLILETGEGSQAMMEQWIALQYFREGLGFSALMLFLVWLGYALICINKEVNK